MPGASDSEVAAFFAQHLDKPCEVEVAPGDIRNIREFYLREAKEVLELLANPGARRFLEIKIKENEEKLAQEKQEQK